MGRQFSIDGLVKSEVRTVRDTRSLLVGATRQWPGLLDLLCKLGYYFGDQPPIETPEGIFQCHACMNYIQVLYSFRAAYLLWECGYYSETMIVTRHLMEVLVQLRYFQRHPEKTQAHMAWRLLEGQNRVKIKTMFEELSPGLYDGAYGRFLSEIVHGGAGRYGFHVNLTNPDRPEAVPGNYFDEFTSSMALNYLQNLLFGYLNLFDTFFPRNTLDETMTIRLQNAKAWLITSMEQHRQVNPKSCDWYAQMDKIMFPDEPQPSCHTEDMEEEAQ